MQAGLAWAMATPVRYLSYAIDTLLLSVALLLISILPAEAFANGWLWVKLGLLPAYIVAGSLALKRAPGRYLKLACFLLALLLYVAMYLTARSHHPYGALKVFGL